MKENKTNAYINYSNKPPNEYAKNKDARELNDENDAAYKDKEDKADAQIESNIQWKANKSRNNGWKTNGRSLGWRSDGTSNEQLQYFIDYKKQP